MAWCDLNKEAIVKTMFKCQRALPYRNRSTKQAEGKDSLVALNCGLLFGSSAHSWTPNYSYFKL